MQIPAGTIGRQAHLFCGPEVASRLIQPGRTPFHTHVIDAGASMRLTHFLIQSLRLEVTNARLRQTSEFDRLHSWINVSDEIAFFVALNDYATGARSCVHVT